MVEMRIQLLCTGRGEGELEEKIKKKKAFLSVICDVPVPTVSLFSSLYHE
jgi:hypothetical protein